MRVSFLRATALLLVVPAVAWACCPAPHPGQVVTIADQEILVAWDAKTKREHFVRRARFDGASGKDFGFLVPTPTKPELAEAPDAVFERLGELLLPERVTRYEPSFFPLVLAPFFLAARAGGTPASIAPEAGFTKSAVEVLEEKRVAGFDAVVLEAHDALALTKWLEAHEFAVRPEITDWAVPYVAAKWKITAFKLPGGAPRVETSAVRMSFATDRPLFPYRTPSDNRTPRGLLRVHFVGSERVAGALGADAKPGDAGWQARTRYSKEDPRLTAALDGAIPKDQLPEGRWLTTFEDFRWPSSGDDLYFGKDADQSSITPPPIITRVTIPLPADVFLLVGGIIWFVRRRRKRAAAGSGAA